jgi:predicted alpha/beta-fold hydrolase
MRRTFLVPLKEKALAKARRFPHLLDARAIERAKTLRAFDDIVTAPLNGFKDYAEYWRLASSGRVLDEIERPALLVSAEDDPLIPAACLPREAARRNPALRLEAPPRGGHVGFVAGSVLRPRFWAEERAIAFVDELFRRA